MIKLSRELTEQAVQHPQGLECQGDGTDQRFVIMDADVLRQLQQALYQKDVNASISEGIADMEAGRMMTIQEAKTRLQNEFGSSAPKQS